MKKLFLLILALTSLTIFSQQKDDIYVFKFNRKMDEITYRVKGDEQEISGFRILINKRKIFFSSSSLIVGNGKLEVNIDRNDLNNIIKNDNPNKQNVFYVFLEDQNQYYRVAYIFRTIYD
ncbi:hypothetical protein [Flavobacterium sp. MDT1-60]|uniref:hypothetical protein n=1 Tax=Flavobacterium sp. MDT1-60 TaxID=1979344 RepID=UPI00177AEE2F|nr:hypothetical protein [Flavobacterium sp. MDT1-60]QOG01893.1 hypothetical protein IHE43_19135 [Flavobacterium sp. MDT1-60]